MPLAPGTRTVDWEGAQPCERETGAICCKEAPVKRRVSAACRRRAMKLPSFTRWAKNFDRWLARTQRLDVTTKSEPPEQVTLAPTRGGVSVELVAIVWELS